MLAVFLRGAIFVAMFKSISAVFGVSLQAAESEQRWPIGADLDTSLDAEDFLRQLERDRTPVASLELEWTVEVLANVKHPELVGCVSEYHGWFDYAGKRCRVDLDHQCPGIPSVCGRSSFSASDERIKVIDGLHLTGEERRGDFSEIFAVGAAHGMTVERLSADPRLAGLLAVEFVGLKNFGLSNLASLADDCEETSHGTEMIEGVECEVLSIVNREGHENQFRYVLDSTNGYYPKEIVAEARILDGTLRLEVSTEWMLISDASSGGKYRLPKAVSVRRFRNGELEGYEVLSIDRAILGKVLDERLFQWAGMNLPDGFVVDRLSDGQTVTEQWNASSESFETWKPVVLGKQLDRAEPMREAGLLSSVFFWINLILATVAAAWAIQRIRRSVG